MASISSSTELPVLTECKICCELYNKSKHKPIICPKPDCNFDCCSSCFKTYILDNCLNPICMNCKTSLSDLFIVQNINKSFYNGVFKKNLAVKLLESEKSKMPETMPFVQMRLKLYKERDNQNELKTRVNALESELRHTKALIWRSERRIMNYAQGIDPDQEGAAEEQNQETNSHVFIMPCRNQTCRGFLNKKYKCEICECHTCPHCLEFMGSPDSDSYINHKCKEENVESAKMIKKDTKPCPKCGTRIHKIDGCDQMWCTECKVAFSWRKGTIEKGNIHNPHYYQWLKNDTGNIQRNPLDVICGGLQDFRRISVNFRRFYNFINLEFSTNKKINVIIKQNIHSTLNKVISHGMFQSMISYRYKPDTYNEYRLSDIHRAFNHITEEIIPGIVREIENIQDNRNLRVDYMIEKINEDKFKSYIIKCHIDLKIKQELLMLWQLIRNFGIDLFNEYVIKFNEMNAYYSNYQYFETLAQNKTQSSDVISKLAENELKPIQNLTCFWNEKMEQMKNLCDYFNEQTRNLSLTYNRTVPVLYKNVDNIKFIKFTQSISSNDFIKNIKS